MKEIYPGPETVDEMFSKYVFDVACHQDEGIRQQLIKLGWTPPDRARELQSISEGKDALLLDMSIDVNELISENEQMRADCENMQSEIDQLETCIERYEDIVDQNNRSISLLYKQISEERRERLL